MEGGGGVMLWMAGEGHGAGEGHSSVLEEVPGKQ